MFPREERVDKRTFEETFKSGKRFSSPFFSLVAKINAGAKGVSRFAVVVSKKISKSAVVRNRCKRRVYHAIRAVLSLRGEKFSSGVYIFFPKIVVKDIDFEKLKNEVNNIFKNF